MARNVTFFPFACVSLAFIVLTGCASPPASSYVSPTQGAASQAGTSLGSNAAGEACTQQRNGDGHADIYCGTWQQPSGRVRSAGPANADSMMGLATGGPWRAGLNDRYNCGDPSTTNIIGGQPAVLLQCTQRIGGWPHVALVAAVGGTGYLADGVLPALPAIERSIGVLSGRLREEAASQAESSGADALLANRLAAKAFTSGDVGAFEQLMSVAARANQTENFAGAETAYRAALALQQKALGADSPDTSLVTLNLAMQVSNEKRFGEADSLFVRSEQLVARSSDKSLQARYLHYRALHERNKGKMPESLALLNQAEPAYAGLLPAEVLSARPTPIRTNLAAGSNLSDMLPGHDLLTDVTTKSALLGLIEVRRYRAVILRAMGRNPESEKALASARELAAGNGLRQPVLTARMARTGAALAAATGDAATAAAAFAVAANAFSVALPDSRPVAETELLRAGELLRGGKSADALAACQSGIATLRQIKIGTDAKLLAPCLDAFASAASKLGAGDRQALLTQMFEASQIAQGGVTSQQIALATARLSENARDPKVAEAIRARQDAGSKLADLYRERDQADQSRAAGDTGSNSTASADLDKRIGAALNAVADADAALQAASPNYGQLVQQAVPAADVMAALMPSEGFISITLTETGGWAFLLRDKVVSVAPILGGTPRMAQLVKQIRASIESNQDTPPPFDIVAAGELYNVVLGGLEAPMQGMTAVVVAPAGPLLSLPFSLLITGPADASNLAGAPWLLRRMAVSHVPAAANFVSLRKIAGGSRAQQPWFGFGDFRPVTVAQARQSFPGDCSESAGLFAGLPLLPFAKRELEAARVLLGASSTAELLGASFTADAVLKAKLKDYRILHFATHALLPAELRCQSEPAIVTSAPSGAVNATGALLTASEVVGLDLDADTVILSACNSGGPGGTTAGESLSGLARSFFYAGARSLMVTHWSVNDQAAAYLVADTLRRLRAGEGGGGISAAMRAAQLGILDSAGKDLPAVIAHPFYWAPFALIGDGSGHKPAITAMN